MEILFLFGWALKFAIGGKTEQGINCPSPELLCILLLHADNAKCRSGTKIH